MLQIRCQDSRTNLRAVAVCANQSGSRDVHVLSHPATQKEEEINLLLQHRNGAVLSVRLCVEQMERYIGIVLDRTAEMMSKTQPNGPDSNWRRKKNNNKKTMAWMDGCIDLDT